MAMKYTRVLTLMQELGGRVAVDDAALLTILDGYKAVSAMSDIRSKAKLEVRTIREGRKAVAYELVAATPATDGAVLNDGTVVEEASVSTPVNFFTTNDESPADDTDPV